MMNLGCEFIYDDEDGDIESGKPQIVVPEGIAFVKSVNQSGKPVYTAKKDISSDLYEIEISEIEEKYAYTGNEIKPEPTVKVTIDDEEVTLEKDTDYELAYTDNTEVGTATVSIVGKGEWGGTATREFRIFKCVAKDSEGNPYETVEEAIENTPDGGTIDITDPSESPVDTGDKDIKVHNGTDEPIIVNGVTVDPDDTYDPENPIVAKDEDGNPYTDIDDAIDGADEEVIVKDPSVSPINTDKDIDITNDTTEPIIVNGVTVDPGDTYDPNNVVVAKDEDGNGYTDIDDAIDSVDEGDTIIVKDPSVSPIETEKDIYIKNDTTEPIVVNGYEVEPGETINTKVAQEITDLKEQLEDLEEQLQNLQDSTDEEIADLNGQIEDLNDQISGLQDDLADLQQELVFGAIVELARSDVRIDHHARLHRNVEGVFELLQGPAVGQPLPAEDPARQEDFLSGAVDLQLDGRGSREADLPELLGKDLCAQLVRGVPDIAVQDAQVDLQSTPNVVNSPCARPFGRALPRILAIFGPWPATPSSPPSARFSWPWRRSGSRAAPAAAISTTGTTPRRPWTTPSGSAWPVWTPSPATPSG